MRELDDFDWVDHPSSLSPDQPDSPGADQSRGPAQSRGPGQSLGAPRPYGVSHPRGAAQSRGSAQSGGSKPSGASARSGGGGSRKVVQSGGSWWARIATRFRAFAGWLRRMPRPVLIAVGALFALIVLSMVIDSALYYNKVHAGVNISDRGLGGLTQDEAVVALTELVEDTRDKPITLFNGDDRVRDVLPDEVGLVVDVAATASAAMDMTRKSNFIVDLAQRLRLYFNGEDLSLVGTVDEEKMAALVAAVAEQLDTPPVNDGLQVDISLNFTAVKGNKGFVVDQDALRAQLTQTLLTLHATEFHVPMMVKEPDVVAEDFDTALSQVATMVSGNLLLMNGDQILGTFTPGQIAAYLDFTSEDRNGVMTLVPHLSASKMSPVFAGIAPLFAVQAVNTTFASNYELRGAWIVPGSPGQALDPQATANALTTAALSTTDRAAQAVVMPVEPDLTVEEAEAMGVKDMLATYQTEYFTTPERAQNVIKATEYTGNVLLAPGEEYNTDKQMGPRTVERGFTEAVGITNPGEYDDVLGGGICQVSTTLFNAVMLAGLEVTERWNHSMYIDHYPLGLDATLTASGKNPKNLRFKNNTDHYIMIQGWSDGGHTRFSIYGTDDGRRSTMVATDFFDVVPCTLEPIVVTDSSLGVGTTEIVPAQNEMKVLVTRTIAWPSGSTTTDTFLSTWGTLPPKLKVGTSTTTTLTPGATTTATTTPPSQ